MTDSRLVRGAVTAVSWLMGDRIRAFAADDFDAAVEYHGLNREEQLQTRVVFKQLARAAGVTIDAFADESGQFRQKYGK